MSLAIDELPSLRVQARPLDPSIVENRDVIDMKSAWYWLVGPAQELKR
jgi:hypothetical protein